MQTWIGGDKQNLDKKRPMYPSNGWIWQNANSGVIEGRLWGGCLEILDLHLSVNRYLPHPNQLEGAILFVETSEEMPPEGSIYRFFAALGEIGLLQKFKALLVGYPKAQFCGREPSEGRDAYIVNQQLAVKSALRDYFVDIPVIFNMNFGHTDPQMIIPNGGMVSINCQKRSIDFI